MYAISGRTSDTEHFYHSNKLELMAITWAVSRFRNVLINIKFIIVTDCQAFICLNAHHMRNPQIVRWWCLLEEFNKLWIVHRSGAKLPHVNAPMEDPDQNTETLSIFNVVSMEDEILMYQFVDNELKRKREILKKPQESRSRRECCGINGYILRNDILYKMVRTNLRNVILKANLI